MTQSSVSEFDVTETANNILSSGFLRETAQEGAAEEVLDSLTHIDTVAKLREVLEGFDVSDALSAHPSGNISVRDYNPFDLKDLRAASALSSKLMDIAEKTEGNGVDAAIGAIAFFGPLVGEGSGLIGQVRDEGFVAAAKDNARKLVYELVSKAGVAALGLSGLRQQTLTLFVAHYPPAHEIIRIKPIDQLSPNLVSRDGSQAWPEAENRVNFWREDAQVNDHHGRWHAVYINSGIPTPIGDDTRLANRHGELFAYMH
ncbi:MAG: hypothetical protein ACRER3_27040, partial [Pseudomonas fluorescens]